MGLTGKYDFPGIKKFGARGIELALGSTSWGAVVLKVPVLGTFVRGALGLVVNWLSNNGLMVLNIGAIFLEGEFDQMGFDSHMEEAIRKVELGAGKLTPEQIKAIDSDVIVAFRKFAKFTH